ncbi:transposase, Ptta/En/Spm [Artemisia annua]|uniref:Transposase, Ptta/En/Spm n=1 Tax=Artemisia annua TaxID=35608 RepID=A0A2U1NSG1_ARTAN|nr:transposase, Ptta/En/Spm [Artemisia annua]
MSKPKQQKQEATTKTFYRWDAAESNQIRDAWESHIGKRYPDIMRGVRKAAMKVKRVNNNVDIGRISSSRPIWITENDWLPMVEGWDTDEWRLKSKTAQENRAKSQSGKHTAGSRSFLHTKIVMENKTGRRVKLVELHTQVHTRKGTRPGEPGSSGTAEFDDYSRLISEKHVENEENVEIDENGSKSPPDDFDVWKGVATSDRGHVLGAGSTKDPAFVLTGLPGSGSIYATHMCSPYEEIQILKKQNDDLKKKMEDERVAAEAQRAADMLAWHKTLNDRFESFAQNYPPRTERPTESDPGPS